MLFDNVGTRSALSGPGNERQRPEHLQLITHTTFGRDMHERSLPLQPGLKRSPCEVRGARSPAHDTALGFMGVKAAIFRAIPICRREVAGIGIDTNPAKTVAVPLKRKVATFGRKFVPGKGRCSNSG